MREIISHEVALISQGSSRAKACSVGYTHAARTNAHTARVWALHGEKRVRRSVFSLVFAAAAAVATTVTAEEIRDTLIVTASRIPIPLSAAGSSVTVIDLSTTNRVKAELLVGLHPSAMALSPDGRYLVVANAASEHERGPIDVLVELVEPVSEMTAQLMETMSEADF